MSPMIARSKVTRMSKITLIKPRRFGDARGWFTESYSKRAFATLGIEDDFVQDNHSLSELRHTLRGLHFQRPPHAQAKLVRCIKGRILDVAVDIRSGSPTYGRYITAELSAENGHQLFVPVGFAHGFLTLEDNCEVTYKVTDFYAPESDGGVRWDDPTIAIKWPLPAGILPELSDKDEALSLLTEFHSPFAYDGQPLAPLY